MYYLYLVSKFTKYIALVSLVITFFNDLLIFKLLCCLIFVDLILAFPVFQCSLLQIIGIYIVKRKFGEDMPSIDNYKSEVEYSLPFNEKWIVINGCFGKEYSHSWDVPTQRYAYDFIIWDENTKSYEGEFKKCENTGNSTEPHLHFQLQTGQSFYNSAGLPIHFGNINLSSVALYEKTDPRPHMAYDQILDGYITRGFAVENQL